MADMTILEWAVAFIKYKDAVRKQNESMDVDESKKTITVKKKTGLVEVHLCVDDLDSLDIASLSDQKVACLNKKKNLDWLIKNWDSVIKTKIIVTFVNPSLSESWAVHPQLHHHITDKVALKPGLNSLFDSIGEVR